MIKCKKHVALAVMPDGTEYFSVQVGRSGFVITKLAASARPAICKLMSHIVYNHEQFHCVYAPLASKQMDISVYNYIYARFMQLEEFNAESHVDYAVMQHEARKTLLGIAFKLESHAFGKIDSNYLAVYRFLFFVNKKIIIEEAFIAICIDAASIYIAGYGDGLWGYSKYIARVDESVSEVIQKLLNSSPAILNNIAVKLYVVSSKVDLEISKLQLQFTTQYCVVNPLLYIASVRPKAIVENKLVFLLGSYLWGSI
jgi:hypothetical protein